MASLSDLCKVVKRLPAISAVPWGVNASDGEGEASELVRALVRQDGAALLLGFVSDDKLLDEAAKYLVWKGAHANSSSTEYVHDTKHRHHMRLRPSEHPAIANLLQMLLRSAQSILLPLVSPLGAVIEFAAFLTNPGASGQHFHTDIIDSLKSNLAPTYSLFLFLSDVDDESEGPLQIAPRSHALSDVRDATRQAALLLSRGMSGAESTCLAHWKLLPIKRGDVAFYDGTVLHRGTDNNSTRTRIVLYMTFMGIGSAPEGSTYAIDATLLDPPKRLEDFLIVAEEEENKTLEGQAAGGRYVEL